MKPSCPDCRKRFESPKAVSDHYRDVHGNGFEESLRAAVDVNLRAFSKRHFTASLLFLLWLLLLGGLEMPSPASLASLESLSAIIVLLFMLVVFLGAIRRFSRAFQFLSGKASSAGSKAFLIVLIGTLLLLGGVSLRTVAIYSALYTLVLPFSVLAFAGVVLLALGTFMLYLALWRLGSSRHSFVMKTASLFLFVPVVWTLAGPMVLKALRTKVPPS